MPRRFLDIRPTNLPPNGIISYKGGYPIITFDIGEQNAFLIGNSVRVCGELVITTDGATAPATGDTLAMDSRLGVFSIVDTLTLSSTKTKQTLESIRNYNRFMSSYLPFTASNQDLIGHLGEVALTLPSQDAQREGVVNMSKTFANEFSVYFPTGLLQNGKPIPLSSGTIGGLTMEIQLAPDSAVLFDTTGTASTNGYSNAEYSLKNVKLICEVEDMENDFKGSGGFEYSSIASYFSTINSTNAILNYSLGMSRVRGVFCNFIKSAYLNNLDQNSMATIMPIRLAGGAIADVSSVVFTKGGTRYPLDYNVDFNFKLDNNVAVVDPQNIKNFMNSIQPFTQMTRTQISPVNTNKGWSSNDNGVLQGGLCWGVGISYDSIGSDGADFSREAFGLQMDLALTDDNPISVFVFVHSKNTLLFNGQGVQVVS
tara:strand:- start:948 stop:2228 length:1281 start_codon:yes stop_codon:yes gene_type:complete